MKDVAARAGVSLKTVSRVVNGEAGVLPATARRVATAIDTLGFRRHDGARMLRTGRTATIGLIMEDIADPFYSAVAGAVEAAVRGHGYLLFTASSAEDPHQERELALALCARRVDGLVIVPASTDHGYLLPEVDAGLATVFADRPGGGIDADTVLTDNLGGAADGAAHLIGHGHRRIGFLGDAPHIYTARQRRDGYLAALREAGIAADESLIVMRAPEPSGVQAAVRAMLDGPAPITALLCGNNRITVAALRVLTEHPRPVALVGFDDFELADLLNVTVVAQDPATIGRIAAERLLDRLAGDREPAHLVRVPTRLIVRGSGESPLHQHPVFP